MRLYRIGDKVVSEEKLSDSISRILSDRESGATQEEAAKTHGVARSFVSLLESLGEIRRGARVALIAFPVANGDELHSLADKYSLDVALVLSQSQREDVEHDSGSDIFNNLLDTMAELVAFETLIICASDWRIETFQKIFNNEQIIGVTIGESPLREDVVVDIDELESVIQAITLGESDSSHSRAHGALGRARDFAHRWER